MTWPLLLSKQLTQKSSIPLGRAFWELEWPWPSWSFSSLLFIYLDSFNVERSSRDPRRQAQMYAISPRAQWYTDTLLSSVGWIWSDGMSFMGFLGHYMKEGYIAQWKSYITCRHGMLLVYKIRSPLRHNASCRRSLTLHETHLNTDSGQHHSRW